MILLIQGLLIFIALSVGIMCAKRFIRTGFAARFLNFEEPDDSETELIENIEHDRMQIRNRADELENAENSLRNKQDKLEKYR